jgi:xylan 1,4-beta-xylosidase
MEINALAAGKPLVHYWKKCVGAGRANEGLRANWLEH